MSLIITGQYQLVYDGNGLQSNRGMTGGHLSEWYVFQVINAGGQVIGEFHVHPTRRSVHGIAAGNFRMFADHAFGSVTIGRALDWDWLCAHLVGQLPLGGNRQSGNSSRGNYRQQSGSRKGW